MHQSASLDVPPVISCLYKFPSLCDLWFPQSSVLLSPTKWPKIYCLFLLWKHYNISKILENIQKQLLHSIFYILYYLSRHAHTGRMPYKDWSYAAKIQETTRSEDWGLERNPPWYFQRECHLADTLLLVTLWACLMAQIVNLPAMQ